MSSVNKINLVANTNIYSTAIILSKGLFLSLSYFHSSGFIWVCHDNIVLILQK